MLRTVGSTLLAQANPGGVLRKKEEARIENPALPGKGEIGSVSRGMLEEPIERQVPAGSTKVVSSAPSVEPTAAPSGILPTEPIPESTGAQGVGLPASTPVRGAGNGAAPDVGLMPTIRSQVTGAMGKTVSGGALTNAAPSVLTRQQMGGQTQVQGRPSVLGADDSNLQIYGPVSSALGGKIRAVEGAGNREPTYVRATGGQTVAGPIGAAMTAIGTALRAPQLVSGGAGKALTSYAYNPQAAKAGVGSVGNALRSVAKAATTNSAMGQAAKKVSGWLRSLFGR